MVKKAMLTLLAIVIYADSFSQTKVFQYGDYILTHSSNFSSTCANNSCYYTISSTDTLARIYNGGVIFWKATITNTNISDTLSASGITGICRVTVPTTFNNQRVFQFRDIAIIFSSANYYVVYMDGQFGLPAKIYRGNTLYCTIDEAGGIDWNINPQWSWLGRVGTTRVKRISLP